MNYALVAYPISRDYRQKLEDALGYAPQYLTVAELRRESFWRLLRRLRGLKAQSLVVPFEDASSKALLPILLGIHKTSPHYSKISRPSANPAMPSSRQIDTDATA